LGTDISFLSLPKGLGFACLYQAAAVMTAKRCRARLAFSNAIARSGMGLTFLIAPFTQLLIDFYSWQGTLLIFGGIMLNLIPSSMLLRPASTPAPRRSSARNHDLGFSTAKEESETLDESTQREGELHGTQNLPTTERLMSRGQDVSNPVDTTPLESPEKPPVDNSPGTATEAKRSYKPLPPAEKGNSQP
ncbi:MOT5 protein, partial [Todus mexicanus]|nr:MOT5 protein [Todus mexicanus]